MTEKILEGVSGGAESIERSALLERVSGLMREDPRFMNEVEEVVRKVRDVVDNVKYSEEKIREQREIIDRWTSLKAFLEEGVQSGKIDADKDLNRAEGLKRNLSETLAGQLESYNIFTSAHETPVGNVIADLEEAISNREAKIEELQKGIDEKRAQISPAYFKRD